MLLSFFGFNFDRKSTLSINLVTLETGASKAATFDLCVPLLPWYWWSTPKGKAEGMYLPERKIMLCVTCHSTDTLGNITLHKGPSINFIGRRGGRGVNKCLCYYISLCSKLAYGGGKGGQKLVKSCLRSLWMVP